MSPTTLTGPRTVYTGEVDGGAYLDQAPVLDIQDAGTRGPGLDLVTLTLRAPHGGTARVTVYDLGYRTINGDTARPAEPAPDPLGLNARLALCAATSPTAPPPLTLGQRQQIRGRGLVERDPDTRLPYCSLCLDDLPTDPAAMYAHTCPTTPPAPVPVPPSAPEPDPTHDAQDAQDAPAVTHKTRTYPVSAIVKPGGCDWHGREIVYDRTIAVAVCSCGWKKYGADREEARAWARGHRAAPDA